ncbi:failed axon connections homolog isoform X1 [Haliotis rufescens]|uniref:failed axon connections homolog isoform X1 n=1 Tax=Haliotis rufescens TaxID=6454 RepID=UPI00201F0079|nr:failed axon connections homolog isoform X1 [Haliotis rufescens]
MSSQPKIVLYQIGRGPQAPSLTPFAVKLETYLRMARIPYTNQHGRKRSPKGKFPWMIYNGKIISDSQFSIDFLNQNLNIDLNSHLNPEQRAIARAFQKMAEENLYWCLVLCRWVYDNKDWLHRVVGVPKLLIWVVARNVKSQTNGHGIGRHGYEEMLQIMEADLRAISSYLGDKQFLFGDKPCETDAAIFGQLSQFRWHMPGTKGEQLVSETFANLRAYCERMKNAFWPDWAECITDNGKRKATK